MDTFLYFDARILCCIQLSHLQGDDVGAASEVLQDLDLTLDLLLLNGLQSFNYALLVVRDVDGLEDLKKWQNRNLWKPENRILALKNINKSIND